MRIEELKIKEEYKKALKPLIEEQYLALKESIKEKGILQDLIINQEKVILDGHHRYKIAKELKIKEVPVKVVTFKDPLEEYEFVLEINSKRRHYNKFQLAEIGMKLLEVEREKAKKRQISKLKQFKNEAPLPPNGGDGGEASEIAAKKVGLAPRTFQKALKVLREGSEEIKELCRKEALKIDTAYNIVRAFQDVPEKPKKTLTEKLVKGEYTPQEVIKAVTVTKVIKEQLEAEDDDVKEKAEKELSKKFWTKELDLAEAIWTIEEISGDSHRKVRKEFPINAFKDFNEAQAWAIARNGRVLGKIEKWLIEFDPIKDKKL